MEQLIEELEPIVTATAGARMVSPVNREHTTPRKDDPRIDHLLDLVARRCAERIREIDRSLYLLGQDVSRLVRHYDRERGLTALAGRITRNHSKIVSRQYLGQALRVFEAYNRDEVENRFSDLTNTHLLKAAQALPEEEQRDLRNDLLDEAQKEDWPVSELAARIKRRKQATPPSVSSEPSSHTDTERQEPRGYVCGDGLTELRALSNPKTALLRVRELVVAAEAIEASRRNLAHNGLLVFDRSTLDGYLEVSKAVAKTPSLRFLHVMLAHTSSIRRRASRDLPIVDCFRVVVLIGGIGFRVSQPVADAIDNPMSEGAAEELVYSLVPDSGLVVDIGTGSVQTAIWAKAHGREYLAVEPDEAAHGKNLADLEASPPAQTVGEQTPPATPDSWPMVSESQRERASIDGASWDDLTCCERTQIAAVVSGVPTMICPGCGNKQTARLGGRPC